MPYKYTPLQTDNQEIRIAYLEPSRPRRNRSRRKTPLIRLRIETTTLHDAGEYTCLSYTWGAPEPKHTIQVNGHDFDVRADLFAALCRLRLPDKPRRLWIDAICIDQDNIPERDSQVAMMQHIFRQATDVIAWIGEDNGHRDQRAVDFVRNLSARAEGLVAQKKDSGQTIDAETAAWIGSITPWDFAGSVWMDFISLVERPWFSRIWIIQEIIMARKITVWCGRHQLNWMEFFHCSRFVLEHWRLIAGLAVPSCLRYHRPGKHDVQGDTKPFFRLLKAVSHIFSVGCLVVTNEFGKIFKATIGEEWMASDLFRNSLPSSVVWAEVNTESGKLSLFSSQPRGDWPAAADQDEGIGDTLLPRVPSQKTNTRVVNQPSALRTLLHHPPGGRELLAVTDDGIPLFNAIGADVDTETVLAGAQISQKSSDWTVYKSNKSIAISGDPISKRRGQTMYDIVHRFRTFEATDARDKVYALIGVAADIGHALGAFPRISYAANISILDVFWDLIDLELRYRRGLGFLSDACGTNRPEGVPSWMPLWYDDISDKPSTPCRLQGLDARTLTRYRADDDYVDHEDTQVAYLDKEKGMLYVHGILMSSIAFLEDMFDRDAEEHDWLSTRLKWAAALGVARLEKAFQVLTRLRRVGLLSAEHTSERFSAFASHHTQAEVERYNSFLGTLLASASDANTQHLVNQPPEYDPGITANMTGQCSAVHDTNCRFEKRILEVCHGRRFFICGWGTHAVHGRITPNFGLCPANAQVGDMVVVLYGSSTPQVIRKVGEDEGKNIYELVGEAYVHTWMQGQMMPKEATRPYKFRLR